MIPLLIPKEIGLKKVKEKNMKMGVHFMKYRTI